MGGGPRTEFQASPRFTVQGDEEKPAKEIEKEGLVS